MPFQWITTGPCTGVDNFVVEDGKTIQYAAGYVPGPLGEEEEPEDEFQDEWHDKKGRRGKKEEKKKKSARSRKKGVDGGDDWSKEEAVATTTTSKTRKVWSEELPLCELSRIAADNPTRFNLHAAAAMEPGMCLDVSGEMARPGNVLIAYDCTGNWNQLFVLRPDGTIGVTQPHLIR